MFDIPGPGGAPISRLGVALIISGTGAGTGAFVRDLKIQWLEQDSLFLFHVVQVAGQG